MTIRFGVPPLFGRASETDGVNQVAKAQDMMTLQISLDFHAIDENGSLRKEEYTQNFSLEQAEIGEVVMLLRNLAEAIDDDRAYGWMSDQIIDVMVGSGDLRPETADEYFARLNKEAGDGPDEKEPSESSSSDS